MQWSWSPEERHRREPAPWWPELGFADYPLEVRTEAIWMCFQLVANHNDVEQISGATRSVNRLTPGQDVVATLNYIVGEEDPQLALKWGDFVPPHHQVIVDDDNDQPWRVEHEALFQPLFGRFRESDWTSDDIGPTWRLPTHPLDMGYGLVKKFYLARKAFSARYPGPDTLYHFPRLEEYEEASDSEESESGGPGKYSGFILAMELIAAEDF